MISCIDFSTKRTASTLGRVTWRIQARLRVQAIRGGGNSSFIIIIQRLESAGNLRGGLRSLIPAAGWILADPELMTPASISGTEGIIGWPSFLTSCWPPKMFLSSGSGAGVCLSRGFGNNSGEGVLGGGGTSSFTVTTCLAFIEPKALMVAIRSLILFGRRSILAPRALTDDDKHRQRRWRTEKYV